MKRSLFPDSLVLIFAMILAAQLVSYMLPAGEYDRLLVGEPGHQREQVAPGTFHRVDTAPLPATAFLTAIPRGMVAAAEIIFFVFLVGGTLGVIRVTGAIDALIGTSIHRFGNNPALLVAGMVTLFALGSSLIGMGEEYIPFVPVLVAMCIALGMDAIVAVALVEVGLGIGHGCAAMNPFTVVLAQRIAEVPIYSGQVLRWTLLVVCLAVGIHHILRYRRRIVADSGHSLVSDLDLDPNLAAPKASSFTGRQVVILGAFAGAVVLFVIGVAQWDWYLTELGGVFLGLTILTAAIGGVTPNRASREFRKGAAELTTAALLIGFARTIEIVLDDAMVKDTIIHGIAGTLEGLSPSVTAVGMLAVQSVFNFFIPSGSGQAFVTMPLMAPLADLTSISRETAVLAFQFGDGFMNMVVPTSPVLMGILAMAGVPFVRWARFIVPLLIKLNLIATGVLVAVVLLGW